MRRAALPNEKGAKENPRVSINIDAGPSDPTRQPSRTSTSNVSLSPSSLGDFNTTTTSCTDDPSLLNTETVALGGSLAKLPVDHSATRSAAGMRSDRP